MKKIVHGMIVFFTGGAYNDRQCRRKEVMIVETTNRKQGYFCIAVTTVLFSLMEIALKFIGNDLNPIQVTFSRFLFGGLVLLPFALRLLRRLAAEDIHMEKADLRYFAFLGTIGIVISMTLYQLATLHANASVVAVLFSSNPLFVMVLAYLILREPIHGRNIAALLLDIVGIIIIIAPWNMDIAFSGVAFTLSATLIFALYTVLGKRKCYKFGGLTVTCFGFLFGSIELIGLAAIGHIPVVADFLIAHGLQNFAYVPFWSGYTLQNLPVVLFVYLGVTGLGFASYFTAMEKTSANTAALVFFFKPVLAPILAFLILHEEIPLHMMIGILFILAGSMTNILPGLLQYRSTH